MPLVFADIAFPPAPRPELRAKLRSLRAERASSMPDSAIEEIVDIACHAAETGRKAMLEVLDRSSDYRVSITAAGIAASILQADLKALIEGLEAGASATGLHFETATLEVQAHG